jgi:hypothetical protein
VFEIPFKGGLSRLAHWNPAPFSTFPYHRDEVGTHVVEGKRCEFGNPETRRIQEFDNRRITEPNRVACVN